MELNLTLIILVFTLSIVQSIFGVGLLLFGTPLLLTLGHPFVEALIYLLPCSMTINLLQILGNKSAKVEFSKSFLLVLCPSVLAGLAVSLTMEKMVDLQPVIGAMLLFSGGARILPVWRDRIQKWARTFRHPYLAAMGLLHGLTNMGGGLLTLFAGSCFKNKESIRLHIAWGYFLMAASQFLLLLLTKASFFSGTVFLLPFIPAFVFLFVGNRIFHFTAEPAYEKCITALIFLFGITLLI